jgi:hypothetical protein
VFRINNSGTQGRCLTAHYATIGMGIFYASLVFVVVIQQQEGDFAAGGVNRLDQDLWKQVCDLCFMFSQLLGLY